MLVWKFRFVGLRDKAANPTYALTQSGKACLAPTGFLLECGGLPLHSKYPSLC